MDVLLLGRTGLGTLGTVLGTGLLTVGDTLGIQSTTHDVITHTGQVLNTAATDQHHAVLLQVVAFAGNVGSNLDSVGQTHTGNLTQSGVRLLCII